MEIEGLFIIILTFFAVGIVTVGGFFLMLGFIWLTEGEEEAKRIFREEF